MILKTVVSVKERHTTPPSHRLPFKIFNGRTLSATTRIEKREYFSAVRKGFFVSNNDTQKEHITEYHTRYQIPLCAGGGKGSNYSELPQYLTHTGLIHIQVLQEQVDFVYTNAQEWWHSRWTHGPRYALEQMTPEVLKQFREEVFARLAQDAQSQSIHETLRLQYILADKEV